MLLALAVALTAAPASAGVLRFVTDKDPKAGDPDFEVLRTGFDCTGRQTFTPLVGWSATVVDSTIGAASDLPGYTCLPTWPQEGPEHIYRLEVAEELEFLAVLSGLTVDLDLFLLSGCDGDGCTPSGCDTDNCLVSANTELVAVLPPGVYFLVVDTYGTGAPPGGTYTLDMAGYWPGVPTVACDTADTTFQPCADAETLVGDLEGQPDLIRMYDCDGGTLLRGGEAWYALATPPGHMVSLTATPGHANLDLALALFTSCGPDAVCLAFADENLSDEVLADAAEVIQWPQVATEQDTLWLAVDCVRDPNPGEGSFGLVVDCGTVPAEKTSFGSLRSRYR